MKEFMFCIAVLMGILFASHAGAADKVVVIPLTSSQEGGPGDWKHVSVSSLGGIPRNSAIRTGVGKTPCGDYGRYANDTCAYEALTVPVQLPDGATIVSFTGLICDNTDKYAGEMLLYRSDSTILAQVMTGVGETSTTTLSLTDTTITTGAEVVDNSKYSYFFMMFVNCNAGSALYPVSGIVTLQ